LSHEAWTTKYRPKTLKEIVGHEKIISQLITMVQKKNIPNLLFHGPPGVGKTTAAWAVARDILGEENLYSCVKELNASNSRKIEDVRQTIVPFTETLPIASAPFKILILDEAEQITNDAQQALRVIMERGTARFILCANDASKIIEPLRSRCKEYRFSPLPKEYIMQYLNYIVKCENIKIEEEIFDILYENTMGDLRKSITILQASVKNGCVRKEDVLELLEIPDETTIERLLTVGMTEDYTKLYSEITRMIFQQGWDSTSIVKAITRYLGKEKCKIPNDLRLRLQEKLLEISPFDKEIQLNSVMAYFNRISREFNAKSSTHKYVCPQCKTQIDYGISNCPNCGVKLKWQ
jgi:replication factor C small subunit